MSAGNYCVAGWDAQAQRMIRPLPNGQNWTSALLQQHAVTPGAAIDVFNNGHVHNGMYPHSTEDTPINTATIQHIAPAQARWFGVGAPPVGGSVQLAFGGHVAHNSVWNGALQGVFVPVGTQVGSLAAISLDRGQIDFVDEFGKLKALVNDGQFTYKLAVSSLALKSAWGQGGIPAVIHALPNAGQVHVRLGLARAFDMPAHKCYMMVNGVNW